MEQQRVVAAGEGFLVTVEDNKTVITLEHLPCYTAPQPEKASPKKDVVQYYKPLEKPTRWPLELRYSTAGVEICLWAEDGSHCWVIAYWVFGRDDASLYFVGSRPLDPRVNWLHFRELLVTGQKLAEKRLQAQQAE